MPSKLKVPVSDLPIMKACCKTCPFKLDEKGIQQDAKLAAEVVERNLLQSQQICHGTEGPNREPHNRCKGYYDYSKEIYDRMGLVNIIKI
jgi:hypothetical protein